MDKMENIVVLSQEDLLEEFYKSNVSINKLITESLASDKKFFIGRIPGVECMICYNLPKKQISDLHLHQLINNAGINVKNYEDIRQYVFEMLKAFQKTTAVAIWERQSDVYKFTGLGQDYLCKISKGPEVYAVALEPFRFLNRPEHWGQSLKGRNILIISSFCESMKSQIENKNIEKIFGDKTWLEGCKFTFVKPPVTLAGNHENKSWQEHFSEFKIRLSSHVNGLETKPDVVLVSCGGYGMPICNYIFSELKLSTVYIGGGLQLFFGIIGKRWLKDKDISYFFNKYREHWIFPSDVEKPSNLNLVEKGCYW